VLVICGAAVALRLMFLPLRSEGTLDLAGVQSGTHSADIAAMETF